jgi:hypothetical protein
MTLAVRNLMTDLRSSGEVTGGPIIAHRDRRLSALEHPPDQPTSICRVGLRWRAASIRISLTNAAVAS